MVWYHVQVRYGGMSLRTLRVLAEVLMDAPPLATSPRGGIVQDLVLVDAHASTSLL